MYLGAPDRSFRYEIGRLLSRAPNRVMRGPKPPPMHLAHPLFMRIIGFPSEIATVGGSRTERNGRVGGDDYIFALKLDTTEGVSLRVRRSSTSTRGVRRKRRKCSD